jgi:hypothetical protein
MHRQLLPYASLHLLCQGFLLTFLLLISSVLVSSALAQTGSLTGVVTDQQTGEVLVGANILVIGTTLGGVTDLEGKYIVRQVPLGTHTVRFSFIGYAAKAITGVQVSAGNPVRLNVDLASAAVTTDEVVVTAQRQLATESAILSLRKKAGTIGDGMSMEQVRRTPDATAGDALRRVTGISIVDNKFLFIRGVTDRYNATTLNGVSVTGTDPDVDKKSFSFDMVPANLVENTMVTKTATPDLPGDFTGGLVQVNTLDFPDKPLLKFSLSTSYNTVSNLRTIQRSQGGGRDWLGIDDGTRELPAAASKAVYNAVEGGKAMPNNWKQRSSRSPLNASGRISFGDWFPLGNQELGLISSISYRNGYSRSENRQSYYRTGSRIIELEGSSSRYAVLWGGLLDLSVKLDGLHKISFKNAYNQSGEDRATANTVIDENAELSLVNVTQWSQRSLYVGQVLGEHLFPALGQLDLRWRLAYSSSRAEEPDRKTYIYRKYATAPVTDPFIFNFADRSWSDIFEDGKSGSVDLAFPVTSEVKVKAGLFTDFKRRDFKIEFFVGELTRTSTAFYLLDDAIDSLFLPKNFGVDKLVMSKLSDPRDTYTGEQTTRAAYIMLDAPFSLLGGDFRIVGGLRIEDSEQLVNTISPFSTNEPYVARLQKTEKLPSVNLTWMVNPVTNIRLAHSQSVNRPEFREMAVFYFYDYNIYEGTYGNPLLQRAYVHNYDFRAEVFPEPGEVLAVSGFYKSISNAIEQRIVVSSNPERTWYNSGHGRNYGFELEVRKSLGFLGDYFRNFSLTGNYTRIASAIEYQEAFKDYLGGGVYVDRFETREREMQGQSPYMVNLSFLFVEPSLGTTLNLMYYEYGKRLNAIGDQRELDVYEEAVGVLDLAVTQRVTAGLELKFTAQDLTARTRSYVTREGNPYAERKVGTSVSAELSFTF